MQTSTQTNHNSPQDGVVIWSSDPEDQKAINQAINKVVNDTFNTLSPEEQEEIKEIEKVIHEGWEVAERLTDPEMQKMCAATCELAKEYRLAKIYQHTSDGKDMLERFTVNCSLGLYPRIHYLATKRLNDISEGLLQGLTSVPALEEEKDLLEFFEKVNKWSHESYF